MKKLRRALLFVPENLLLISIMAAVSLLVMVRAYWDGYYISPDSALYLREARELLRGNGFYLFPDRWFGTWPIGYPAAIALTSKLTGTEIYLASKLLNISLIWILGFSLQRRFGRSAWAYALVMLNTGFINTFSFTWSETLFILGLVFLTFETVNVITADCFKLRHYAGLTAAGLLMFLSRYVGAIAVGVIGLLWLYNLVLYKRHPMAPKRLAALTISGAVLAAFIGGYLLMTLNMTGYLSGTERLPVDNYAELVENLKTHQLYEMKNVFGYVLNIEKSHVNLALTAALILFIAASLVRDIKARRWDRATITAYAFLAIGSIYWCAIVIMRFTSHFDLFTYRLLFPASALIFLGFVALISRNKSIKNVFDNWGGFTFDKITIFKKNATAVVFTGIFVFVMFCDVKPQISNINPAKSYTAASARVLGEYTSVPDGAAILWGDRFIDFLRDFANPSVKIYNKHSLENFFKEYESYDGLYIYIPGMKAQMDATLAGNDELLEFFGRFRDSEELFVQIK